MLSCIVASILWLDDQNVVSRWRVCARVATDVKEIWSFSLVSQFATSYIDSRDSASTSSVKMGRLDSTKALLGPEVFEKVRTTPVLVVGAGGIGCELCQLR